MSSVGTAPGTASCIRIGPIGPAAPVVASLAADRGPGVGAICQGSGHWLATGGNSLKTYQ